MLEKLRDMADDILDLFSEYYALAEEARRNGDIEQLAYWADRTMDLSAEYQRIKDDIHKISNGEFVL